MNLVKAVLYHGAVNDIFVEISCYRHIILYSTLSNPYIMGSYVCQEVIVGF